MIGVVDAVQRPSCAAWTDGENVAHVDLEEHALDRHGRARTQRVPLIPRPPPMNMRVVDQARSEEVEAARRFPTGRERTPSPHVDELPRYADARSQAHVERLRAYELTRIRELTRSGYVAANSTLERSAAAAADDDRPFANRPTSMTARRSSSQSSSTGTAPSGIGSEMPTTSPVEADQPAERREPLQDVGEERLIPHRLGLVPPLGDEHEIDRPVAGYLIRDAAPRRCRVANVRRSHARSRTDPMREPRYRAPELPTGPSPSLRFRDDARDIGSHPAERTDAVVLGAGRRVGIGAGTAAGPHGFVAVVRAGSRTALASPLGRSRSPRVGTAIPRSRVRLSSGGLRRRRCGPARRASHRTGGPGRPLGFVPGRPAGRARRTGTRRGPGARSVTDHARGRPGSSGIRRVGRLASRGSRSTPTSHGPSLPIRRRTGSPPSSSISWCSEVLKVPAHVWREMFAALVQYDDGPELARIAAPVLLIWGDHDGVVGPRHAGAADCSLVVRRAGRVRRRRAHPTVGGPIALRGRRGCLRRATPSQLGPPEEGAVPRPPGLG